MRCAFAGLVAVGVLCSVAWGQNTQQENRLNQPGVAGQRQPGQPAQPGQLRPAQGGQTATADQQIAATIFGCCHNEVELAKFVQSRLQTQEAKQFAEKMIADHTPDCEKYQRLAGNLATSRPQEPGGQRAAGGQLDWVSIHRELDQQCLDSTKKELSQKQGTELDHCYLGQQVMAHMAMRDALTVLKNHASPQLAQQIDESLQTVDAHLKEAKQLVEQQKDRPSERVSRRPEGSK